MSLYNTQEELDEAVASIKEMGNELLIDHICEAYYAVRIAEERMETKLMHKASEIGALYKAELKERLEVKKP